MQLCGSFSVQMCLDSIFSVQCMVTIAGNYTPQETSHDCYFCRRSFANHGQKIMDGGFGFISATRMHPVALRSGRGFFNVKMDKVETT